MDVTIELTGTTPLLQHNVQLADPDNEWAREVALITSKRTKTEQDRAEIKRLEWHGGLYVEDGRVVMPSTNVLRCIGTAAGLRKLKAASQRALSPSTLSVPLDYDGPKDIPSLWNSEKHRDIRPVRNGGRGGGTVIRCRPRFDAWGIRIDLALDEVGLSLEDLTEVTHFAGRSIGLGDGITIGMGRFTAVVKAA